MNGADGAGRTAEERLADKAEAASAGLVVQALAKADRGFTMYLPNNPLHEKFFEEFRKRVDEQTRLTHRVGSLLKEYFPQVLEWCE